MYGWRWNQIVNCFSGVTAQKNQRTTWSVQEVTLLKDTFGSLLDQKKYPKTEDIRIFCKKHGIDRDPLCVKSKLQYLMLKAKR